MSGGCRCREPKVKRCVAWTATVPLSEIDLGTRSVSALLGPELIGAKGTISFEEFSRAIAKVSNRGPFAVRRAGAGTGRGQIRLTLRIEDPAAWDRLLRARRPVLRLKGRASVARRGVRGPVAAYDPNQPRDERGRWTDGGGGGAAGDGREDRFGFDPGAVQEAQIAVPIPTPTPGASNAPGSLQDSARAANAIRNWLFGPSFRWNDIPNPYPRHKECRAQYDYANEFCADLWHPSKDHIESELKGKTPEACVYGQVSYDCLPQERKELQDRVNGRRR